MVTWVVQCMNFSIFLVCDERIFLNRVWSLKKAPKKQKKKTPAFLIWDCKDPAKNQEWRHSIYWSIHLHNIKTQGSVLDLSSNYFFFTSMKHCTTVYWKRQGYLMNPCRSWRPHNNPHRHFSLGFFLSWTQRDLYCSVHCRRHPRRRCWAFASAFRDRAAPPSRASLGKTIHQTMWLPHNSESLLSRHSVPVCHSAHNRKTVKKRILLIPRLIISQVEENDKRIKIP